MTDVQDSEAFTLDTTDVDRYVGKPLPTVQLSDPVTVGDIRRWAQGMQYPNPLHYDADAAAAGPFGAIIAPQSFSVACDIGHGASPSIVGNVPGSHMNFGGDEWWFYGPRILPGDHLHSDRRFLDYVVKETKFAGPTMFARGETTHVNQRGENVSRQVSTSVRYNAERARELAFFQQQAPRPTWTEEKLVDLDKQRVTWITTGSGGDGRRAADVTVGEKLVTRPIGPHTIATFTTEWRAFPFTVWGSRPNEVSQNIRDAGWLEEMAQGEIDEVGIDPGQNDGLYKGPSRGHADAEHANLIGMPRGYGYGASMGAWALDYLAYWGGAKSFVRHSRIQYRFPPFEGDVTFIDGEVTDLRIEDLLAVPIASIKVTMTNQDGNVLAAGTAEVELLR
jgi:acyl dehydratase